jgi:Uma2 family endonuclease
MAHAAAVTPMTLSSYLDWEATQSDRHELVGGEVFAMAGAEDRHVTVCGNVYMALRQHLRGTPCRVFMADMKLAVDASSSVFYPDVLVTCSAADAADRLVKREPVLLVEVLSPSTAAYDLGAKFAHYRRIPTLVEYLVVDIDARRADLHRKGADGLWVLHPADPGEPVRLASVDLAIGAEALWAEVDEPGGGAVIPRDSA